MISLSFLALLQVAIVKPDSPTAFVRVNQLGYLPAAPKVAVFCALDQRDLSEFVVTDNSAKVLLRARPTLTKSFGPCATTYRLDFSRVTAPGQYHVSAGGVTSPLVRIRGNAYAGAADTLLFYMREQRSGYNPLFRTVVHTHDGIVVDDSLRAGRFIPVTGG
ncbi:MAG TPA: cellulase N-terminal Ig-like domain-containing protein, partial [Gemmatimonadaceae bacterium]|nr:cellulase N-terminal Ig-like domain-containing protein [Gemmatimonadaceae bacterium]